MTENKSTGLENMSPEELISRANTILDKTRLSGAEQRGTESEFDTNIILEKVWNLTSPMVMEIEASEPGHMAGLNKVIEMKELAENSETIGKELGFVGKDLQILKIVLGTHDVGRHVEKSLNLHTMRAGVRHGALSLLFLSENNLLEELTDREKYIVLFSVYHHAEKEVPRPNGDSPDFEKTAYEMCYALRDLDKEHDLGESKYFEPKGILIQLKSHYLSNDSKTVINGKPELEEKLQKILVNYETGERVSVIGIPESVGVEIKNIMEGKVHPDILKAFEDNETADIRLLKNSWSSYLSFRLAMMFDVKNKAILKNIVKDDKKYIDKSIEYINRYDPKSAKVITDSLNKYIEEKLGEQIYL